ncbi:MAG: bifunctional oligoribonuclease/PAP phosphatase NrnA [Ruminococcaceae bacterium]|nr:bifunctional oligoribonuclease/PAP phosphatase NrnA [Oscillospiraceae bacterium]
MRSRIATTLRIKEVKYMDFKKLSFDELCEKLCENKKTLIVYHARPDADAIGSAFALKDLLGCMGIFAICACDDEVPERLSFMSEDVQGGTVLDDDMLLGHERAISVDSASPSQLGRIFERLRKDIDIMIDHHGSGTVYADNYIRPEASATAEIIMDIAKWLLEKGKIAFIPPRVYSCIYTAISSDTGCFKYSNVTPQTHIYASELVAAGVDAADINHRLFESKTLKQLKAEGEAARRLAVYEKGRIAAVTFPYSSKFSLALSNENLESIIDIPRSLAGVEVAFAVRQPEDKPFFRVSMRSNCDFDVSAVCVRFGGGGHVRAAGCSLEAPNVDEAEKRILAAVLEMMKK